MDIRLASEVRLDTACKAVGHLHIVETDMFCVRLNAQEVWAVLVSLLW